MAKRGERLSLRARRKGRGREERDRLARGPRGKRGVERLDAEQECAKRVTSPARRSGHRRRPTASRDDYVTGDERTQVLRPRAERDPQTDLARALFTAWLNTP